MLYFPSDVDAGVQMCTYRCMCVGSYQFDFVGAGQLDADEVAKQAGPEIDISIYILLFFC